MDVDWPKTGIEELDYQHAHIARTLSEVTERLTNDENPQTLTHLVEQFLVYTNEHFALEEGHMRRYGYPGLENHRLQHDRLREKLAGLVRVFGDTEEGSNEAKMAVEEAAECLHGHLRGPDDQLAVFLAGQKA